MVDDHTVDVPPADNMVVIRNSDEPGVIGRVATILGDAGINIDDMDVGRAASGDRALMVIATTTAASVEVQEALRSAAGVTSVHAVSAG